MSLPHEDRKHTYADYLTWPENERWEIIDGVPYRQSAPKWEHQSISEAYTEEDKVQLTVLPDFTVHLRPVFDVILND